MAWIYYSIQMQFFNTVAQAMSLSSWRNKEGDGALRSGYFISKARTEGCQTLVQD